MKKKSVVKWDAGDVFLLPLQDGSSILGQVVGREHDALGSVGVALFDCRLQGSEVSDTSRLDEASLFSLVLTSTDFLDSGRWKIIGGDSIEIARSVVSYEKFRVSGFVGAKVYGSALVEDFANAFFGLQPWDDWYVPDYLDSLLISADRKPVDRLIYSGRHPR